MKNKLIASMLLLTVQINGMDKLQELETSDSFLQFPMEMGEEHSSENSFIKDDYWLQDRVDQLNEYYLCESRLEGNEALQDLNKVFNEEARMSYFENLVLTVSDVTNDAAM